MSSLVLAHGAPELKLVHTEFGLKKTAVASAVASILATSRGYIVKAGDEVSHIEKALGAHIGQNIYNTKNLVGQMVHFDGYHVTLPTGTTFPAANDENYSMAA